tara:strand:- start:8015 stop:10567 length:2553 start_codon:yes stop_codon:yes gene_type:complete
MEVMHVVKRDGTKETVSFDKVSNRLSKLVEGDGNQKKLKVDYIALAQKVCGDMYSGVRTYELDELSAQTCAGMITECVDYGVLASRLAISNHHKRTSPSFSETIQILYESTNKLGKRVQLVTKELYNTVMKHKVKLNQIIDYSRDYDIDYFGFKTLEKSYLLKVNGEIVERPQHMFLRVSLGIHGSDIKSAIQCYNALSQKKCIHATPTLFNAGTVNGQLASCFLMGINSDSIVGIYDALKDTALISKNSGGIGIHIHDVRARGAEIAGGTGISNGIVPMLRVFNNTARYVDQGGGKRNGSFAIYLEPWHLDIHEFLQLRKNQGFEEVRARDLFYAMWIPDLFMKRVQENGKWTLMCPHSCPGLSDVYGDEFEELYTKYENMGLGKQVDAQEIWFSILESQTETGTPYILFKDSCNKKSNQKNLGTIKSSNLCCEIVEHTSNDETAVCNLASISLPACVIKPNIKDGISIVGIPKCAFCLLAKAWCDRWNLEYTYEQLPGPEVGKKYPQISVNDFKGGFTDFVEAFPVNYDYEALTNITKQLVRNLNKVIDKSTYPIESARRSNIRHRPIGIGVQGLADVFMKMRIGFDSQKAKFINDKIFETIYFAAVQESMTIAMKKAEKKKVSSPPSSYPGAYSTFEGSPMQKGQFQFDLWDKTPSKSEPCYDWESLRKDVQKYGIINSLLVAPMPTASTAQILGNTECFEPITSNIYVRRTLAGEFVLMNKYLQEDLESLNIWNSELKNSILANDGSIQHLNVPNIIKDTYKTVWEISQRVLIDLAADRGKYICQSQSLNLFVKEAKFDVITSMLFHAWKVGLKTGVYYLRTRPQSKAQSFTIAPKEEPVCESCSG